MYAEPPVLGLATEIRSFGELYCWHIPLQTGQEEEF